MEEVSLGVSYLCMRHLASSILIMNPVFTTAEALKLIQRTVAKFAPGVAQLLPTHKSRLDRFKADGTPSVGYSMMRNRTDRKSTRLNSSHVSQSRMPSSA